MERLHLIRRVSNTEIRDIATTLQIKMYEFRLGYGSADNAMIERTISWLLRLQQLYTTCMSR